MNMYIQVQWKVKVRESPTHSEMLPVVTLFLFWLEHPKVKSVQIYTMKYFVVASKHFSKVSSLPGGDDQIWLLVFKWVAQP